MGMILDLVGCEFDRWFVAERGPYMNRAVTWLCVCECGTEQFVYHAALTKGVSRSCGCLRTEMHTQHGLGGTPTYKAWWSMIDRCENIDNKGYWSYGGRGVWVCAEWHDFANFVADVGERPDKNSSLDRIDNEGAYRPGNCQWTSRKMQMRNRRNTLMVEVDGVLVPFISACEDHGVRYVPCLKHMMYHGVSAQASFDLYRQKEYVSLG